jgi:hypothetical protein
LSFLPDADVSLGRVDHVEHRRGVKQRQSARTGIGPKVKLH